MYAMHGFALVIVDEFSQLSQGQFERILRMWHAADNFPALIFAGDKYQLPGVEPTRPWHSPAWASDTLYFFELTEVWRATDKSFLETLDLLRTCMPTSRELQKICRGHKAWVGQDPSVADVKRLLRDYPRAVWVAATKRGVAQINRLALEALHPRTEPVATLPGAFEDNPDNYKKDGMLLEDRHLVTADVPIHQGLKLYLTRNVRKADDYVNGMQCKVLSFDAERKILWVRTDTGKRLPITLWTIQITRRLCTTRSGSGSAPRCIKSRATNSISSLCSWTPQACPPSGIQLSVACATHAPICWGAC